MKYLLSGLLESNSLRRDSGMTSDFENSVTSCQFFVVSICMLSVIRPNFEVVKEGWILDFVSVYRRFVVNASTIQWVAVLISIGPIPAGPTRGGVSKVQTSI